MRVLYDGVAFQNTYQRGIQRVFREIIGRLPEDIEAVLSLGGSAQVVDAYHSVAGPREAG